VAASHEAASLEWSFILGWGVVPSNWL